ncbi:MAG: hypothetical protein O7I93_04920 [Gemmatimonadetes bacterium]|nr:hypothetical protein [Gemmatimonadota bacterium]
MPRAIETTLVDNLPAAITLDGKSKRIEVIRETWRIDDEWWRDQIARSYMEVILEGGGRVMLYEDLLTGEWFLQR